jgi:hypothetical protein
LSKSSADLGAFANANFCVASNYNSLDCSNNQKDLWLDELPVGGQQHHQSDAALREVLLIL